VFDERAEGTAADGRDDGALVELDVGARQSSSPFLTGAASAAVRTVPSA
jgi:hypothetical protein